MSAYKRYFLLLIFSAISSVTFGQAASSPFSTFGIGEPFGNALIQNQGMGGVGVSQPQFWSLNNQNPALLVFNYYTVFQAGALMESRTISGDSTSQKNVNGNLSYLVTAFPVKPGKWTTSVGIMPLTKVNYKLLYTEDVIDHGTGNVVDTANVTEQGTGGLSQLFWANGVRVHENWSVGIKATYVFGSVNTDYTNYADPADQVAIFRVGVREQTYIKDFQFGGGISFSKDSVMGGDYRISAGGTYNFATKLNADKTSFIERRYSSGSPITSDTIVRKDGSIFIPASFTLGFSIAKGSKWSASAEFSSQDWSKFSSINEEDEGLEKAWKASLGAEFTPDQFASKNYLKRITYRTGFSYEKTPISINNKQLKDIGFNFGLSLPTGRSSLDLAFRAGKRGNKSESILEESYFKIYFGITFNDQWFIKRRFD